MDRFTGGCLCGNVRIVASGLPSASAFVTVSLPQVSWRPLSRFGDFPQDAVTIDGETHDHAGGFCPRSARPYTQQRDEIEVNLDPWMLPTN